MATMNNQLGSFMNKFLFGNKHFSCVCTRLEGFWWLFVVCGIRQTLSWKWLDYFATSTSRSGWLFQLTYIVTITVILIWAILVSIQSDISHWFCLSVIANDVEHLFHIIIGHLCTFLEESSYDICLMFGSVVSGSVLLQWHLSCMARVLAGWGTASGLGQLPFLVEPLLYEQTGEATETLVFSACHLVQVLLAPNVGSLWK